MYLAIWYDGSPTVLAANNDVEAVEKFQTQGLEMSSTGCALWRLTDLSGRTEDAVALASYTDGEFRSSLDWTVIGFHPDGHGCATHLAKGNNPTEALRNLLVEQEVAEDFQVVDVILGDHTSAIQQATMSPYPVPLSDFA